MNVFLKIKHWQLFLLIFGLPILSRIILVYNTFANPIDEIGLGTGLYNLNLALSITSTILFFLWMWSVGIGLQNYLPKYLRFSKVKFKTTIIISFSIILIYLVIYQLIFGEDSFNSDFLSFAFFILFVFMIIFSCILLIPLLYCFYYISKTIKTLEMKKEVKLNDFISEFLILLIFPVGIWFIQPKINKLLED